MSYGQLMGWVRETWGSEMMKVNGSIVKALWRRYSAHEVEAMVKGAKLIGAESLRMVWAERGEGRRNALTAYYRSEQKRPVNLQPLGAMLKQRGLV